GREQLTDERTCAPGEIRDQDGSHAVRATRAADVDRLAARGHLHRAGTLNVARQQPLEPKRAIDAEVQTENQHVVTTQDPRHARRRRDRDRGVRAESARPRSPSSESRPPRYTTR